MSLQIIAQQFVEWTKKKIRHHNEVEKKIYFREREIWWAALGKNIGCEVDGKNDLFERPVLILKKYSKEMCFILPLTTQVKDEKTWYQAIVLLDGKANAINISQGRVISNRRLLRKMAALGDEEYEIVFDKFIGSFNKK